MGGFGDFFNFASKARDYALFREFLVAAVKGNNGFVVNYLDKNPAALNRTENMTGSNVLMAATMAGSIDTIKLLLERGASLGGQDKNGFNVLHMAVLSGKAREATELLLKREDIGAILHEKNRYNGLTALMYASMSQDDSALIQSLLDKGADPTQKDFKGRTALMIAQENNRTQTAALLAQWKSKPQPVIRRTKRRKWGFDL